MAFTVTNESGSTAPDRPYIVSCGSNDGASFEAVINCASCATATEFARNYFGDFRGDIRNRNTVEYLHSDFDQNHTYRVNLSRGVA